LNSFARFLPGLFELLLILILLKNIDIPNAWLNNGLIAPLFALLIFTLGHGQGIIAKFLSLPIFIILGNASYAMYILHIPVLVWMHFINKVIGIGDSNSLSFFLFYIVIITGVSVAAFYVIETPLRKVVINRLGKRLSLQ
jgi:peptidoglycan/LPS O-acetylase OafA/YrhL